MHASRRQIGLITVVCILAAGCGRSADPTEVVARIDDKPLLRSDLEAYFRSNLLDEADEVTDAETMDRIKSRLFDAWIDEQMLLEEAERRNLQADDVDVRLLVGTDGPEPAPRTAALLARRRLTIANLQQDVARGLPSASDEQLASFMGKTGEPPRQQKRVLLRSVLFESVADAKSAFDRIRRGKLTFADAARAGTDAGRGASTEIPWESLSEELRGALERLKPGEVSRPVEHYGEVYLFQVEAWISRTAPSEAERTRRAREALERERLARAMNAMLRDLRRRTVVRIEAERLPFRYVSEPTP